MRYCTKDAAIRLGVSRSFLNKMRVYGGGPRYLKLGRRVVYDLVDLDEWALAQKRENTSHR